MKKILLFAILTVGLASCYAPRTGCQYQRGKPPKFTAFNATLDSVLYSKPGRAILRMKLTQPDTTCWVYYHYFRGWKPQKFTVGDKYRLVVDMTEGTFRSTSICKI